MGTPTTYGLISRANHWAIALAMIGMLCFGLFLEYGGLEREARRPLVGIHRSIGVIVLIFGTWRVVWRLVEGFPADASAMPRWHQRVSRLVHWSLLAGILIMPLSGITSSVFRGRPVDVFGWFTIPAQSEIPWLATAGGAMHSYVGIGLSAVVVLHVLAALKHHLHDRDATLTRMLIGQARTD
ncbi:cytochrome b [Tateyamaria sp. SN3-11]|uniref:cytochrome b n=1 Tax=Tateyamaria sp. SN3-11 TaxID=3092147 RepID=UPI0039E81776